VGDIWPALPLVVGFAVPLLTLLLAVYWHRLPSPATFMRKSGGLLRGTDLGLAQVELLPGWRPGGKIHAPASLQATDPLRRRYLLVLSESRSDFTDEMNLREYSRRTFAQLTASVRILEIRGPEERQVSGLQALQTEAVVAENLIVVTYLHTAIEGERGFHQVITWATPSHYDRAVFERLLDNFAEIPGPKAAPRNSRSVEPASRYDVH
jgi:hypothetical protein